jgi:MFS family permease
VCPERILYQLSEYFTQHCPTGIDLTYAQACFLLLCGRLAELYKRKFVWIIGYLITGTCGLIASFARCMSDPTLILIFVPTLQCVAGTTLDIVRGLQGICAAAMIPASVGLLLVTDLPVHKVFSLAFYRGHSLLGPRVPLLSQPSPSALQLGQPSAPFSAVSSLS